CKDKVAKISLYAPEAKEPTSIEAMLEKGSELWLLQAFRELDDAILRLRFFHRNHGLWQWSSYGDSALILDAEKALYDAAHPKAHWFIRELALHIGRVFRRLDVSSRSMLCLIDEQSAFAGVLAELLFLSDRSYAKESSIITLSVLNRGLLPTWSGVSRLETRFLGHQQKLAQVFEQCNAQAMSVDRALELELLTFVLDHIDFDHEVRLFKEERMALSPDALSAMEANLRFNGPETLATKIFGRLSAWQNWVFIRDNATGPTGALSSYGQEKRAVFDFERC
ncbi:MAG TPA: benzoyl-CoA-dihydrodiol lyase, partial [Myxococcota bacterium]|nr:benzoyl-CoA-dihydrodiol lyase [Myxococcota bacterium]